MNRLKRVVLNFALFGNKGVILKALASILIQRRAMLTKSQAINMEKNSKNNLEVFSVHAYKGFSSPSNLPQLLPATNR